MTGDVWVFGYGSLVWRPAFPYLERHPGRIEGWVRRFWQGSTDHRGVPEDPGRVVTLIPEYGARCFGVVYRVGHTDAPAVLEQLDVREQGGYARHEADVTLGSGRVVPRALVYVATPRNPNYAGPAPLEAIAEQVRDSHGPSGSNLEYVLELERALRSMGADDPHVFAVASLCHQAPEPS